MIKRVFFIGFLVVALTMFTAAQAMAATGQVTDINPSGKVGKILRFDDNSNTSYVFLIPRGLADSEDVPVEGEFVTFDVNPAPARVAHNVAPGAHDPRH